MPRTFELDQLTNADTATHALRRGGVDTLRATPCYIRHKPQQTTIVAYELELDDGSTTFGYAHWCAEPARADEVFAKAISLRPRPSRVGVAVGHIDPHTVFYGFPNDARLRRLRWYVDSRKLKRSLAAQVHPPERISGRNTQVKILRYKPERRVVARIDLATSTGSDRPLLLRYSTQRRSRHLAALAVHLRRHGVNTPAPIAQLDRGHVGIDEFIDGRQLRDVVRAGDACSAQLAEALHSFHSTPPPPHVAPRPVLGELTNARRGLDALCEREPALVAQATAVAERLERSRPGPTTNALIHGDLHAKNILIGPANLAFVDLERVGVGSPAIDLGYLVSHALALEIRQPGWSPDAASHAHATVDRYRSLGGGIDEATLQWHIAVGLVDQALLVSRHLEGDWRSSAACLLDAARSHLAPPALITGATR